MLPAALEPVAIAKPWGREVWFSGVEPRGESRVVCDDGQRLPLSRYLAARGRSRPVVLLKALHPTDGDMYLEVHDTKCEVYVVDAVDERRWPSGGRMLLGASGVRRRALGDARLRAETQAAAEAAEAGSGSLAAVREYFDSVPLRPGDAVTIPPRTPHSLLCGIDVIEFQTPNFERLVLAASQPLATQPHWDAAPAVAAMDLDAKPVRVEPSGACRQTLATTPQFTVVRCQGAQSVAAPDWSVAWLAEGTVACGPMRFEPRSAFIVPRATELRLDGVLLLAVEGAVGPSH